MATPEKPSNAPSSTPKTAPAETKAALANTSAEVTKDIAEKQTVKDLEDLARDVQLNRLKEAEQSAVTAIQALPNTLDPEKATKEQLDTLDTFHMGGLFLIREVLKNQPAVTADNISEFFKADISKFKDTEKAIWNKLKNIAANKDKYPKLYQDLFGQWAEGIALMKQKVEAEKPAATTSEGKAEGDKDSKEKKDGTLFDKILDVAQRYPLLASIGAVGLGIALYNMWKNGGWQKGIVIGLFALVGLGALTSDSVKGVFEKMGVNMDDEDKKDKGTDTGTNASGAISPSMPPENTKSDIEKYNMKPMTEVMGGMKQQLEYTMKDAQNYLSRNEFIKLTGGLLLAQNPLAHSILHGAGAVSFHSVLALAQLSFTGITHHPVGAALAVLTFAGSKDKLGEKAADLGNTLMPSTPEDMRKYLKDKLPELQKYCIENNIPLVKEKEVDGIVDILYGEVPLQKLIPRGEKIGQLLVSTIQEKVGATPEKLVHNANTSGFKHFLQDIEVELRNPESAKEYEDIKLIVQQIINRLQQGNALHAKDIALLTHNEKLKLLGFRVDMNEGYVTLYKYSTEGILEKDYPKRLGIDPSLPPEKQQKKAKLFTYTQSWTEGMNGVLTPGKLIVEKIAAIIGEKTDVQSPGEYVGGLFNKGWQMAIVGGEVVLMGAKEKYILGNIRNFQILFTDLKEKPFSVVEYVGEYANGFIPVMALGTAASLAKLRNPLAEGWTKLLMRSALYPINALMQGGMLVGKHILPHVWAGEFHKVLSNPKNVITHDFYDSVRKWQGIAYSITNKLPGVNNSTLADMAHELADAHRALYLMHSAENRLLQRANLESAEKLLQTNHLTKGHNFTLSETNLKSEISKLEEIVKKAETTFKAEKLKSFDKYKKLIPQKPMEKANIPGRLSQALDDMEALAKNTAGKSLDTRMHLMKQYEEHINNALKSQAERAASMTDTDPFKKNLEKILQNYSERAANIRELHAQSLVGEFKKLPVRQQTAPLAEKINAHILSDSDKLLTRTFLNGKGQAKMYMATFVAGLAITKGAEIAADPEHDMAEALESIASWDTLQLAVDLFPFGVGFTSSLSSVFTGKKSLSFVPGAKFESDEADRLTSLGWGIISIAGLAAYIPGPGTAISSTVLVARLTALAKTSKVAAKLLEVFPKIIKVAERIGWDKTVPKVLSILSNYKGAIGKTATVGSIGMMGLGVKDFVVALGQPRDIELAVPYEKVNANTVAGTMPRQKTSNQDKEHLAA